jgi:hypothetical protein
VRRLLVTASVIRSSPILFTLMKEALSSSETSVHTSHGVTSQKRSFFIVTAVRTSNHTEILLSIGRDAVQFDRYC